MAQESSTKTVRTHAISALFLVLGMLCALVAGEILVRVASADQRNYVIEMWRYALTLKKVADDPAVGHDHRPNSQARLENVDISINSLGLRGPEPVLGDNQPDTVAVVGDSIALGWGVPEDHGLRAQLEARLGPGVQVVNSAVGNMTMSQVVAHWAHLAPRVRPRVVALLTSIRAAEAAAESTEPGWLLRHSQLAALAEIFLRQWRGGTMGRDPLVAAYRAAWSGGPTLAALRAALGRLAELQHQGGFDVIVAQVPDLNDLQDYRLDFATQTMAAEAKARGWRFVDLLPPFAGKTADAFRVSPQDFHPNGAAFGLMADQLAPLLRH